MSPEALHWVHYVPVASTVLSALFLWKLLAHYRTSPSPHVAWWAFGVFAYGLGTGLEGAITLFGNNIFLTKSWYIAGALLGGYPLATGTVYLLCKRRTANILTFATVGFILAASALVVLSPADVSQLEDFRPSGKILGWQWVRLLTPFINIYAAIFLIGGAIYSAVKYFRSGTFRNRAIGNTWIAIGAILPGIGGSMAKFGVVEALYIGEFVGIILIWLGYRYCAQTQESLHDAQKGEAGA